MWVVDVCSQLGQKFLGIVWPWYLLAPLRFTIEWVIVLKHLTVQEMAFPESKVMGTLFRTKLKGCIMDTLEIKWNRQWCYMSFKKAFLHVCKARTDLVIIKETCMHRFVFSPAMLLNFHYIIFSERMCQMTNYWTILHNNEVFLKFKFVSVWSILCNKKIYIFVVPWNYYSELLWISHS